MQSFDFYSLFSSNRLKKKKRKPIIPLRNLSKRSRYSRVCSSLPRPAQHQRVTVLTALRNWARGIIPFNSTTTLLIIYLTRSSNSLSFSLSLCRSCTIFIKIKIILRKRDTEKYSIFFSRRSSPLAISLLVDNKLEQLFGLMLLGKRGNRSLSSLKFIKELIKFIRKFLHDDARNRARQFHTAS